MSTAVPRQLDIRALATEIVGERLGCRYRRDWVLPPGGDEDTLAGEPGRSRRRERDQRMQQQRAVEELRRREQHRGEDIGAVRIAEPIYARRPLLLDVRADEGGEDEIAVFVELESGQALSADELRAHNAAVMPRYMQPAHIFFIDVLPQTPTGKVQKHPLAPLLVARGLQPAGAA